MQAVGFRKSLVMLEIADFIQPVLFPSFPQNHREYADAGFPNDVCAACPRDFDLPLGFGRKGHDASRFKNLVLVLEGDQSGAVVEVRVVSDAAAEGRVRVMRELAAAASFHFGERVILKEAFVQ